MKLWIDDVRPAPKGWQSANSVEYAIHVMMYPGPDKDYPNIKNWEECSLDHDLGGREEDDGIRFVDWMCETGNWPKKKPVVHSMNPAGRLRMERTIDRYFPGER